MKMKLENIEDIARDIIQKSKEHNDNQATIIALHGDLGAGKTTLVQNISKILGVKENIISPTFVIMKGYILNDDHFKKLIHIDAYRLEDSREIIKLGWGELIKDRENLILLEWPEKIGDHLPKGSIKVEISHINENEREVKITHF